MLHDATLRALLQRTLLEERRVSGVHAVHPRLVVLQQVLDVEVTSLRWPPETSTWVLRARRHARAASHLG
jgi:hypothetical protein